MREKLVLHAEAKLRGWEEDQELLLQVQVMQQEEVQEGQAMRQQGVEEVLQEDQTMQQEEVKELLQHGQPMPQEVEEEVLQQVEEEVLHHLHLLEMAGGIYCLDKMETQQTVLFQTLIQMWFQNWIPKK